MLITISFWTVRAQGIIFAYYNLFNIARLPDSAFRGFFKMFFTFALPMLLVANVPAKTLLSRLSSPWEMGVMFLVALVFLALSSWFWNFSLNRYTSASS
jgi:ABC-2 type transport system permease protein